MQYTQRGKEMQKISILMQAYLMMGGSIFSKNLVKIDARY
ncbi:hypothetical protein QG37_08234 [Candidozyma auris]|uniref:Uncharacterized protein n=1 Tax=Candidozyma auris TaxID=498019 RepID=A0A0L0NMZ4_CANAR|nr:hypothetical protein QG37_08234 [[Candida] auris]